MSIRKLGKAFAQWGCLFSTALLVIVGPFLMLPIMLIAGSERTIFERSTSPSGWSEARVQFDDAGAISGFERLVFVKGRFNPSDAPLLSCRAFWGHGQAEIDLKWLNSSKLLVRHHFAPDNVADVAANCGDVRIIAQSVRPFEKF